MTSDTKVIIGVVIATVIIIIGGGLYAQNKSGSGPATGQTVSTDDLVRADDPFIGPEDAKVTVVEFGDFQCPSCGAFFPILKQTEAAYADQSVKFVFRQFPLTTVHEFAQTAAEASVEAQVQGKFWEFHDVVFENQPNVERASLEKYAEEIGLDMNSFRKALDERTHKDVVAQDVTDGRAVNVRGTPTIFINGAQYTGQYSVASLSSAIDAALNQ